MKSELGSSQLTTGHNPSFPHSHSKLQALLRLLLYLQSARERDESKAYFTRNLFEGFKEELDALLCGFSYV